MFKLVFLSFGIGWQEDVVVYPLSKNGSGGAAEEPFWVLDSTFFSNNV